MLYRESVRRLERFSDSVPIGWLLSGEPWVRYRTLTDILEKEAGDGEVVAAKDSITSHQLIVNIFGWRNRDGYWGTPKDIYTWWPKKNTTFWILGMLADFGLSKEDRRIAKACEYLFSTQLSCGGFGCAPPPVPYDCFTGILAGSLAKLGYLTDPRLQKAYDWLQGRQRLDGGFWCKNSGLPGGRREKERSCAFGTLCVLGALVQKSKGRDEMASRSTEFLLRCWERRGTVKYAGHDSQIGRGWEKLKYPFTDYRVLSYLDTLSQLESVKGDDRMAQIVDTLIEKRDERGCFCPESIHMVWSDFDFGQKKLPSRWITVLAYRIVKRFLHDRDN